MALCIRITPALLLLVSAATVSAQQTKTTPQGSPQDPAPIIQPGAPGQSSKAVSAAAAGLTARGPAAADVAFMQGMVMHHSQAVEMTELLRTRSKNKELQLLGNRISISQTDEIKYMKQWLQERGQPVTMDPMPEMKMDDMKDMKMGDMKGMKMDDMKGMPGMKKGDMPTGSVSMNSMAMMPGMLTPEQMAALEKATGPTFDHLFLTGMIQHHTGALTMVQDLYNTPGAGQDNVLFDFATDVDNTQRAEINIMKAMLKKEKK